MAGPYNQHQLEFVERFAEALFDGFAQMAIPIPQIVANFSKQFELIGGKPAKTMSSILAAMPVFLGPDFNDKPVAQRRFRVQQRLAGNTSQLHDGGFSPGDTVRSGHGTTADLTSIAQTYSS